MTSDKIHIEYKHATCFCSINYIYIQQKSNGLIRAINRCAIIDLIVTLLKFWKKKNCLFKRSFYFSFWQVAKSVKPKPGLFHILIWPGSMCEGILSITFFTNHCIKMYKFWFCTFWIIKKKSIQSWWLTGSGWFKESQTFPFLPIMV